MKTLYNDTNTYQEVKEATRCLVLLLQSLDTTICPFQTRTTTLPIEQMKRIARYNKLTIALTHIITCKHCASLVSSKEHTEIQKIAGEKPAHLLLVAHEKKIFQTLAKQVHMRYVYIKDKTRAPLVFSVRHNMQGTDIDVLVPQSAIPRLTQWYKKNGYTIVDYNDKEVNFINKKTHISIDVHKTIAYPHSGDPLRSDASAISEVTTMCLASKTPYLSLDILLLTSIVRYWSNDLARGLKHLLEILELSFVYEDTISWETLIPTLQRLGYYTRYLYMLLLGKKLLGITRLPRFLAQASIPKRISLLASLTDITDCIYMDDFCTWHTKPYHDVAKRYYEHYLLTTYISDIRYPRFNILHPRFIAILTYLLKRSLNTIHTIFSYKPQIPFPFTINIHHANIPSSTIGKARYFTINGTSMSPFLIQGMIVGTTKPTTLKIGDIVVVSNKKFVGHRITNIFHTTPTTYEIKGDAVYTPDGTFLKRDIVGVVTTILLDGNTYNLHHPRMRHIGHIISYCSRHELLNLQPLMCILSKLYWMTLKNQRKTELSI